MGKIDGASHLRPGPLEPRMATVLLVPPISSALRTRFSKKENKQLMDSGAPKVCCFILFVTGNVRMRMRRHELLAARRVFLKENLIFLGMKTPARCFWEPSNTCNLRRKMMIDFIDIENTSLPPFCVIFGRKVEVVEEAGQSLPNETPRFPTMNRTGLDARNRGRRGWAPELQESNRAT